MEKKTKSKTTSQKRVKKSQKSQTSLAKYIQVYDISGKIVGKEKVAEKYFAAKENPRLVAQAIRVYLANQAKNSASTKSRGEVVGSTRKIRRQKGTGMARQGSARAPHRVGGGVAFGPKAGKRLLKLPKKAKQKALASVFTTKFNQGSILAIENLQELEPKTKKLQQLLDKLSINGKKLLVLNGKSKNVKLAARNLNDCDYLTIENLNTYQVLISKNLIFEKSALSKFKSEK